MRAWRRLTLSTLALLSSRERRTAQQRWERRIAQIENGATAGITRLTASARAASVEIGKDVAERARRADNPEFYLVAASGMLTGKIKAEYEKVDGERIAAITAAAMESGYLFGISEGARRMKNPQRVEQRRVEADREAIREQARLQADDWKRRTAERAAETARAAILTDVLTEAATLTPALLSGDRYRSELLARNMTADSARGGMLAVFRANDQAGWVWIAQDDACDFCWSQAGLVFSINEPFESHVNCLCSQEPVETAEESEGFDANEQFSLLSEREQIRVLGPARYDLWSKGDISVRDLARGGRRRTLRELTPPRRNMGDIPIPLDDLRAPPRGMRLRKASASDYITADGVFTPARQKLHDDIVEKWLADKTPQDSPQMLMLGGGPASGKTTLLKSGNYTDEALAGDDVVTINADDIKEELAKHIPKSIADGPDWAAYTHEESSYLSKRIIAAATERRLNVVLDAVGSNVRGTRSRIASAREAGYRVSGMYVSIPVEEALTRSAARAARSGRLVPDEVIADGHIGVSRAFPEVAGDFDELILLDNAQQVGKPATVIARRRRGRLVIENDRLYDEFMLKGAIK